MVFKRVEGKKRTEELSLVLFIHKYPQSIWFYSADCNIFQPLHSLKSHSDFSQLGREIASGRLGPYCWIMPWRRVWAADERGGAPVPRSWWNGLLRWLEAHIQGDLAQTLHQRTQIECYLWRDLCYSKDGISMSYFSAAPILKMVINGYMYLFGYDTLSHLNGWLLLFYLYPTVVNLPKHV